MLAKYGEALTFHAPIIVAGAVDHAGSGDWTPAAGDVKVSKDQGAQANITTLPTFTNGEWQWSLSATEMEAAIIYVKVVDSSTKAVEDQAFLIQTYGHASAQITGDLDSVSTFDATSDTVDIGKISGDSTAADNLEADYDGTGYNKSNSTIGTTTTNADMRGTDGAFLATSAPANFSSLGINGSGHLSRVVLVDTTTLNSDMRGTDGANTTTPPTAEQNRIEMDANSSQLAAIVEDTNELQSANLAAQLGVLKDGIGWVLAQEVGAVSNPQTATAQYNTTFDGTNYRVVHSGLTEAGVRGTPVLSKP